MINQLCLFFTFLFAFSTKLSLTSMTLVTMVTKCHFELLRLVLLFGVIPASYTKIEKNPRRSMPDPYMAGPRSAVGNVSGYRCVSDCRSRGREFDPGPVPYFRGD